MLRSTLVVSYRARPLERSFPVGEAAGKQRAVR
jgi:hypothetical protein